MGYTALKEMQEYNKRKYGEDLGPRVPPDYDGKGNDLKSAALCFVRNRCQDLRFSKDIQMEDELKKWDFKGKSKTTRQIPYNMQMDIDRLCLEKALGDFIESGTAEDAYYIYFAYLDMFFGKFQDYKNMVGLLSEYEANGSSLLKSHRDHYSHSVYVFALGLAIYEKHAKYREAFKFFYRDELDEKGPDLDHKAANLFMEYWGLTALFHDIGYSFELPFEQVISYFEMRRAKRDKGETPFIAYRNVNKLIDLGQEHIDHFQKPQMYGMEFATINELLAHDIADKLGEEFHFSESHLFDQINRKPTEPERFNYFMDHAFFSAARLYHELTDAIGVSNINRKHIDALSAILLHNSLFKYTIAVRKEKNHPLPMKKHPLAWLLMLCDELQCWDRTSYGRNSRRELHPWNAAFDFSDNRIKATYIFDLGEQDKIDEFEHDYEEWVTNGRKDEKPELRAYSDIYTSPSETKSKLESDIEKVVGVGSDALEVEIKTEKVNRSKKHTYLSSSNFLHMCDFAVRLNGRYNYNDAVEEYDDEKLEADFEDMSLEYKFNCINSVKALSFYLDKIGCFYTDRPVDYDMLPTLSDRQIEAIAQMEHGRWNEEHTRMGWRHNDFYKTKGLDVLGCPLGQDPETFRYAVREQTRCHESVMDGTPSFEEVQRHYEALPPKEKDKDGKIYPHMLRLIKKYDGLRVYQFDKTKINALISSQQNSEV